MKIASICMESELGTVRGQESGTTTPVVVIISFLIALLYFARSLHTKQACNALLLLLLLLLLLYIIIIIIIITIKSIDFGYAHTAPDKLSKG